MVHPYCLLAPLPTLESSLRLKGPEEAAPNLGDSPWLASSGKIQKQERSHFLVPWRSFKSQSAEDGHKSQPNKNPERGGRVQCL